MSPALWLTLGLCSVIQRTLAATNVTFTWIQGPTKSDQAAVYGTAGVYASTYTPCGRSGHCASYSEPDRRLYVFGGDSDGAGSLNDVWAFDTVKYQWAFLTGSPLLRDLDPVQGSKGVPSAANTPGGLVLMGCVLSPADKNLYVYGGAGFLSGEKNDLWRFNTSSVQWVWLSGNNDSAVCLTPTPRVESDTAVPCHRSEVAVAAHPSLSMLFVHGGIGYDVNNDFGTMNDLWQYNIENNKWTWLSGSLVRDSPGNFGVLNVASIYNVPLARSSHQIVFEATSGNLFLFGGIDYAASTLWDMWTFAYSSSMMWTWIGGNQTMDLSPSYGAVGAFNALYMPGGRYQFSMSLRGVRPQIVLSAGTLSGDRQKNDVWLYDIEMKQWAFIGGTKGSVAKVVYGVRNQTSPSFYMGIRYSHSMNCYSSGDTCLVFGGYGVDFVSVYGVLSDVWRLDLKDSVIFTTTSQLSTSPSSSLKASSSSFPSVTSTSSLSGALSSASSNSSVSLKSLTSSTIIATATSTYSGLRLSLSTSPYQTTTTALVSSNASPIESNPTVEVIAGQNMATFELSSVTFIGAFALGAVMLTVIVVSAVYFVLRNNKSNVKHTPKKPHDDDGDTTSFDSHQMTNMTSSTTMFTGTTMMSGRKELSMPGFLECQAGTDFRWEQKIAEGGGGAVYIGRGFVPRLMKDEKIIVKILNTAASKSKARRAFNQECTVMHYLSGHRNIALLLGWCSEPVALLMKYYKNGTLSTFIKSGRISTKSQRLVCLKDISNGLQFMHSKGIAHCDIKPDNVLVDVDASGQVTYFLTDFGITGIYSDELKLVHAFDAINLNGVTIIYAAPEAIRRFRFRNNEVTKQDACRGDVFSTAMIVYTLLHLSEPWGKRQ